MPDDSLTRKTLCRSNGSPLVYSIRVILFNFSVMASLELIEPFLKGQSGANTRGLLRVLILVVIAAAAVSSRLFSVIRKYSFKEPLGAID